MIYAELGIGNGTFLSTEVEVGGRERRIKGLIIRRFVSAYLRIWIGKRVLIIDSREGVKTSRKSRRALKLLVGVISAR